jgi:hypothetical protein
MPKARTKPRARIRAVEGCTKPQYLRQRCLPHYRRWLSARPSGGPLRRRRHARVHGLLARAQMQDMTFQRPQVIAGVLWDTVQCTPPWEEAASAMSSLKRTWSEQEVVDTLNAYIVRRHRIVHDGDLDPATAKARSVRRQWVEDGV